MRNEKVGNQTGRAGYVDGFVLAVPRRNLPAYRRLGQTAGKNWRKHGALDYKECVSDDLKLKWGGIPFPRTVKLKPGETVVFAYIVFTSRAQRDRVNAQVMKDPIMNDPKYKDKPMPFDMNSVLERGAS